MNRRFFFLRKTIARLPVVGVAWVAFTTGALGYELYWPPERIDVQSRNSSAIWAPRLSSDGLEMFWTDWNGGDYDIWTARRDTVSDPWEPGEAVQDINSLREENAAVLSPNGLELVFGSWRSGGFGGSDLWRSTRVCRERECDWSMPENMGPIINTGLNEGAASFTGDGLSMYVGPGWGGGPELIHVFTRTALDAPWSLGPDLGPTINANADDYPAVSPDNLTLFFASSRPGSYTRPGTYEDDIWKASRRTTNEPFGEPVNLGPIINGPNSDTMPFVDAEGNLYYNYNSIGGQFPWQLYRATPLEAHTQVLLSPKDGQLAARVYAVRTDNQTVLENTAWRLESLVTEIVPPGQGLETHWYTSTNLEHRSLWDDSIERGNPSNRQFVVPSISWSDARGPVGYPPEVVDLGDNQDDYSVQVKGEIFIPEPGVYRFKDGVNRYAYLAVAGQELIEDSDGVLHHGRRSPIVTLDMSDINANGEWVPIEFRMSAIDGRDNAALYWDYDPSAAEGNRLGQNKGFPPESRQQAGPEAIVPESHLRHGEFRRVSPDQVQVVATGTGPLGGPGMDALLNLPATTGDVVRVTLNLFGDFEIDGANYFFDVVLGNSPLADLNRNGSIDVNDVDLLATAIRTGDTQVRFDLNADSRVNDDDQRFWVKTLARTYYGDANLDGEFNSARLCAGLSGGRV